MDRIALITGASRGLGHALARALAPTHHVVAVARTVGALEELDDAIRAAGGQATLAPLDVTVDGAMQQLCRSIHDRWGKVDLWAHTAIHATALTPTPHITAKDFGRAVETNVLATQRLITYVAPLLGLTGTALFFDDPQAKGAFWGTYGSTKAAQRSLVQSWQEETRRTGPKVHLLTPRPMPTATRARFHPGEDRDALASTESEAARLLAEAGIA